MEGVEKDTPQQNGVASPGPSPEEKIVAGSFVFIAEQSEETSSCSTNLSDPDCETDPSQISRATLRCLNGL